MTTSAFANGDLVEVDGSAMPGGVCALGRIRESANGGRLHVAFEIGQYFAWIDDEIQVRRVGGDCAHSSAAKILHAGLSTALLQLIVPAGELSESADVSPAPPSASRPPFDTVPAFEDES